MSGKKDIRTNVWVPLISIEVVAGKYAKEGVIYG